MLRTSCDELKNEIIMYIHFPTSHAKGEAYVEIVGHHDFYVGEPHPSTYATLSFLGIRVPTCISSITTT